MKLTEPPERGVTVSLVHPDDEHAGRETADTLGIDYVVTRKVPRGGVCVVDGETARDLLRMQDA